MDKYLYTKFDIRKLGVVDENSKNIFKTHPPYYLFSKENADSTRNKVIFFGSNFKVRPFPKDEQGTVETYNKCLDFVRRECADCKLYYKPHPTSSGNDEQIYDLHDFEIIKERTIAEILFYENFNQIKYVFSADSTTSLIAYSSGLNAYVFYKALKEPLGEIAYAYDEGFFKGMPESFFISDLNQSLRENKTTLEKDVSFENHLAEQLNTHKGTAWFTAVDPGFLLLMFSLSKLIKKLSPNRKVGLLIMRHERWNSINMSHPSIKENFDEITYFSKVKYTLKPDNLLNAIKTVIAVKKFKMRTDDIIFGIGIGAFLENCFISYFKNNLRIGVTTDQIFDFTHHFENNPDPSDFEAKWAVLFFNNIIEPILGLHKGIRLRRPSRRNGGQFTRYREAVNKVFDIVYIFKYK